MRRRRWMALASSDAALMRLARTILAHAGAGPKPPAAPATLARARLADAGPRLLRARRDSAGPEDVLSRSRRPHLRRRHRAARRGRGLPCGPRPPDACRGARR